MLRRACVLLTNPLVKILETNKVLQQSLFDALYNHSPTELTSAIRAALPEEAEEALCVQLDIAHEWEERKEILRHFLLASLSGNFDRRRIHMMVPRTPADTTTTTGLNTTRMVCMSPGNPQFQAARDLPGALLEVINSSQTTLDICTFSYALCDVEGTGKTLTTILVEKLASKKDLHLRLMLDYFSTHVEERPKPEVKALLDRLRNECPGRFEYQWKTGTGYFGAMHCTAILSDSMMYLGSANLSTNGLAESCEMGMVSTVQKNISDVREIFNHFWDHAREIKKKGNPPY
eukprot:TRINITY_DN67314_c0_g1_i1.p1 TRINITY_DN67314_c0_g1~~TRINITY_DN67314_c0_g1_i1.p1  ORF type:complete len:290 (-),score=14.35 TRINITY_DN67314_c0_g1_i1:91-960(-)